MGSRKLLRVFVINLTQCKYCMFSTMFFNSLRWVPNCRRGLSVRLQRHGDWLWVGASHSVAVVTIKSTRYSWTCSGLRLLLLSFDVHPVTRGFGRETHRWRGGCVTGTGWQPGWFPLTGSLIEATGSSGIGVFKSKSMLNQHLRKQGSFRHRAYAHRCGTSGMRAGLQVTSEVQARIFAAYFCYTNRTIQNPEWPCKNRC